MKPNGLVRIVSLLALTSVALTAQVARQGNAVPLKNWANPLYWQPSQPETRASGKAQPQLQFSANQVSADALTFIAITPCRLVDTRGSSAGFIGVAPFNGPSIPALGTVSFPVQSGSQTSTSAPAPCGTIPSIAEAYSLNITVVPHSSGAVDYISLWPEGGTQPFVSTLDDPQGAIISNAAIVPAGTPSGGISFYNNGPAATDVIIDMNGFFAAPTDALGNTAVGAGALTSNGGFGNTAVGNGTLADNATGDFNTASGSGALNSNTGGSSNTASGASALFSNTTGGSNTAVGQNALNDNTTGSTNTAVGAAALRSNTTGGSNIAVGYQAGLNAPGGNSNSIYIGTEGTTGDASGTIAIGTQNTQTSTFIAGISGASVSSGVDVLVNSSGQLGTVLSSRRFKEQITDMGDTSSKLFQLRPVNFFYKPEYDDGSHLLQYGLIAEEAAKVYPEMVAYDNDGQIMTVKYQMLAPMLLNEVQKQNARVEKLEEQNRKLEDRLAALEALLAGQTAAAAKAAGSQ